MVKSGPTTKPNSAAHQSFDVGVKALIVQDRRLLLLKRRDHHVWEMPGGRINQNETIETTLLRELAEELPGASDITIGRIAHARQTEFTLPNGNRLMLLFFEVRVRLPKTLRLSQEHEEAAWLSSAELEALQLQPQVRQAALLALT